MGMSTHIMGFCPPDAKWKKMKKIYDSCMEGDIDVPDEVDEFFNYVEPIDLGVEIDLEGKGGVKEWGDDSRSGYQIELLKLPKQLTHIRVFNSW